MDFEEWLEEYREDKNRSDADWHPNNVQIFEAGQQSKQAEIRKAVLSLRNEFNLWADDTEPFHVIEAQIEQIEELLK